MVASKRLFVAVVSLAALLVPARAARADSACIAAYEQTQTLRKDGKLLASKAQAALCAKSECPVVLAKDCARWLIELEAGASSVVFEARTPTGLELVDVRVSVDDNLLSETIDGKAVALDPGTHVFRFEADGAEPVERRLAIREGEKHRKISVVLPIRPVAVREARPIPLGVWIFGGASLVALATSTVFALDGLGQKSDLDACKPHCSADDVDAMSSSFTVADVALGAGVMAGATAAYLFFTRPERPEPPRAAVASRTPNTDGSKRSASSNLAARDEQERRAVPFFVPLNGGAAVGVGARF